MSLEMKYFILKPRSKSFVDQYALASRGAMREYARIIEDKDPSLANDLMGWAQRETDRAGIIKPEVAEAPCPNQSDHRY